MSVLESVGTHTLRMERFLPAPPETVWRWLIEPELRARWFAGGTEPRPDEAFQLRFDHDELSDGDAPYPPEYAKYKGAVGTERVLEADAPRRLVFTWGGGAEGTVLFELEPHPQGTRLLLTHSGISGPKGQLDFGGGWASHLDVLEARLAGRPVPSFWALFAARKAEVAAALAANAAA